MCHTFISLLKQNLFKSSLVFHLMIYCVGCSVSNNPMRKQLKLLQKGKIKDDSSFVYHLPYEENKTHLLVQGYFSRYTHKNRAALDLPLGPALTGAPRG